MRTGRPPAAPNVGSEPSLLDLMRAEFTIGKRWGRAAMVGQLVAVTAGIVGTIVRDDTAAWGATLLALFALLLGYVCQLNAERCRALGEKTRRAVIVRDGLGWTIEPRLETDLRLAFGGWATRLATREPTSSPSYFGSTNPIGAARLRDHLQESAFWQAQLSKRMAAYALAGVVATGFALLAGVLLALNSLDHQDARSIFAKALASLIPFLVTTNLVRLWWSFSMQGLALEQFDADLEATRARAQPLGETDVLRWAHEYDIELLGAPEIPDWAYRRHRAELNRRWTARAASAAPSPAPTPGSVPP